MQSQSRLPAGVRTSSARWPMAKAGKVCTAKRSGASIRHALEWPTRSFSSVVQDWPPGGTNCRSSSQIGQRSGGAAASGYCIPQAVQRNSGHRAPCPRLRHQPLQRPEVHRARDQRLADHHGRRALHPQRLGEARCWPRSAAATAGSSMSRLQPRPVEADALRLPPQHRLRRLLAQLQQRVVQLGVLALALRREQGAGGEHAVRAEDGQVLQHPAHVAAGGAAARPSPAASACSSRSAGRRTPPP